MGHCYGSASHVISQMGYMIMLLMAKSFREAVVSTLSKRGPSHYFSKNFLIENNSIFDAIKDYVAEVKNASFPTSSNSYK